MIGVGNALLTWVTGGSALSALSKVLLAVCALVFGLIYRRYLGILGANRRQPAERQAYDGLRKSLAEGSMAARLYAERLTRFLHAVDRFFGDAGKADWTLFPHVFGLRTPAPLWTTPALDRCLLLALLYPVAAIFVIWSVSGHVGRAEAVLGLKPNLLGWQRTIVVICIGLLIFGTWRACQSRKMWARLQWVAFSTGAVSLTWPIDGRVFEFSAGKEPIGRNWRETAVVKT